MCGAKHLIATLSRSGLITTLDVLDIVTVALSVVAILDSMLD